MDHTQNSTRMTPANVPNARRDLKPLPLRVAESQYDRLIDTRSRTGISVQEHIRRAIDLYLAVIEKEAIELGLMVRPIPQPVEYEPNLTNPSRPVQAPARKAPMRVRR